VSAPACIAPGSPNNNNNNANASKINKEEKLQVLVNADSNRTINFIPTTTKKFHSQHCFTISYRRENQRHYELKCNTESECSAWIVAIREARYGGGGDTLHAIRSLNIYLTL
jgi:PH domain